MEEMKIAGLAMALCIVMLGIYIVVPKDGTVSHLTAIPDNNAAEPVTDSTSEGTADADFHLGAPTDCRRHDLPSHCGRVLSVYWYLANLSLHFEEYRLRDEKHDYRLNRRCGQYLSERRVDLWPLVFS